MNRTVEYEELLRLFPSLSAAVAVSMHCLFEVNGAGRHIKRVSGQPPQYGAVSITAVPSSTLSVRLAHSWPGEASEKEVLLLDDALLLGIAEGIVREEWPPMGCRITSVKAGYVPSETTPVAVRIAAALAVSDMCRRPGWGRSDGGDPPLRTA